MSRGIVKKVDGPSLADAKAQPNLHPAVELGAGTAL